MKSFVILFLSACCILAAPFETKLVGPEALQNYEHYLATLDMEKNASTEASLKRSLLYKLINISKYAKENPPRLLHSAQIEDADAFIEAFHLLLGEKKRLVRDRQSLHEMRERASYLRKRIGSDDRNRSLPSVEELQYAFYYRSGEKLQKRIARLEEAIAHNMNALEEALGRIVFDTKKNRRKIEELQRTLHTAQMQLENLKIEKERLLLLGREERANETQQMIERAKKRVDDVTEALIEHELIRFFAALQSKSVHLFDIEERIAKMVESLREPERSRYAPMLQTLEKMGAERLGKTKILLHRTQEGLQLIEKDLWQRLQAPLFSINEKPISAWDLIVALFILVVGFTVAGLYRRYIRRITHTFINVTPSNQIIVSNIGYYLILTVAFFIMLKSMGLDLSSLTLIAGALSVGIGFGLQNIVANFISGIILLFEKSIKIGDFLEINDTLRGRVVDIHMRSITIRTNDNIDILVPNQTFIQNDVINWTLSDSRRRMRIPFGVAYGTDIKKVKSAILEALQNSSLHFIRDDETKQPMVVMTEMGSSSVNFELFVWVEGDETLKPLRTADKFLVLIYNTLYENGIEIPFPQLDLHVREIKDRLEIITKEE
ncbi:mechanosensitive ion channel domain-containing protein [Hydrogenimonas sp.]